MFGVRDETSTETSKRTTSFGESCDGLRMESPNVHCKEIEVEVDVVQRMIHMSMRDMIRARAKDTSQTDDVLQYIINTHNISTLTHYPILWACVLIHQNTYITIQHDIAR